MMKRMMTCLIAWAMLVVPVAPAMAKGPKYAKTEVEKAVGKCVGSVLLGALGGALLGAAIGGKKGVGAGAAVGAAGGGVVCGILMANAKHRDRIIQAQMAAAMNPDRPYTTSWNDDNGQPVTLTARSGASRTIDASLLQPVRYPGEGGVKMEAPVLDTGGQECRQTAADVGSGGSNGSIGQLFCRTAAGDWQPYSELKA